MLFGSILSLASLVKAGELALYWGQASAGSESSLADYCTNSPGDIYIISFISSFGSGNQITMDIRGQNTFFPGTGLLNAPDLGKEIQTCQKLGKKVLISLGGAAGQYGFNSSNDAENVAEELWDYFGGGQSSTRPFGDAKIDGFDLDGENNVDAANYIPFVNKLRQLYAKDSSKKYYVSAAPQCPYPDATTGQAIAHADLDFLFIQFYNNYCSLTGNNFNFDTWQNFATTSSPNKDVKLFVGLAGSTSAAGSGYATLDQVKAKTPELEKYSNFAGFMVWDASQANQNIVNGVSFAEGLEKLVGGSSSVPISSSSSSSITPTHTSTVPLASSTSSSFVPSEVSSESTTTSSKVWWTPASTSSSTVWWTPSSDTSSTVWWTPESTSSSTVWWTPPSDTSSTVWWTPESTSSSTVWWTPESTSSSTVWWTPSPVSSLETPTVTSTVHEKLTSSSTTSTYSAPVETVVAASSATVVSPNSAKTSPESLPETVSVPSTIFAAVPATTNPNSSTVKKGSSSSSSSEITFTSTEHSTSVISSTIRSSTTITSAPPSPATPAFSTTTSNGVVLVYETIWHTDYTTVWDCQTKVKTIY